MAPRVRSIACLSTLFLLLPALLLLSSAAVAAEPDEGAAPPWDQEKVAALAQQLADAAEKLQREMARQKDPQQVGSGQAAAMLRFRDEIRVARDSSRSLARSLKEGKSREETTPTYRRLMTLVRDARESGRKLFIREPALGYIAEANAALDGLAPYYPGIQPG
jgi:hypothetical protein